jgi:bacillithiol synthase
LSLEIRPRPLHTSGLAREYLSDNPAVRPLYGGDPFSLNSYQARLKEVGSRFSREQRQRAASALSAPSEQARQKLESFVEHGGAVVTTGQQAGLFTGPLFTVYKALTAVRLAASLESSLGATVLPVFWTASEDHDWAEVNHTFVVDDRDVLHRLELASDDVRPVPMSERLLGPLVRSAVDGLEQVVGSSPLHADVLNLIREAYQPGQTVAAAFRQVVLEIFGAFGLFVTDAADSALKAASVPVLLRALTDAHRHEVILRHSAEQIADLGFAPQVPILPAAANLFVRTRYGRERLYRDARGWITRESRQRYSTSELEHLLESEPVRLSPNVLLRPVVEGAVFPVLAYVAGPGEITYFGQLRGLFEAHGVGMPVIYPRSSMLLIERRVQKHLERIGLAPSDLLLPQHELIRRRSGSLVPTELGRTLQDLRGSIVAGFDRLERQAAGIDRTLSLAVGSRRNRALVTVKQTEDKILRALARKDAEWQARLEAAANHLAPSGTDQERTLNVIPVLARHGRSLLSAIAERIPILWRGAPASAEPASPSAPDGVQP